MKAVLLTGIAVALAFPMAALPAQADNHQQAQPERIDTHGWAMIEYIKLKPGAGQRAEEIVRDYFLPADRMVDAQSGIHGLHMMTGEWDMVYVFPLKDGVTDLTWRRSPDQIAWIEKMAEIAGGMDQAMAIMTEWDSLVAHRERALGYLPADAD